MVIGITGGVGTGKSTILQILKQEYHAHLIIADDVAEALMMPGGASYAAILEEFGTEILCQEEGRTSFIDRAKLAAIVFQNPEKLSKINALVHPLVRIEIEEQIAAIYEKDPAALIVLEAALLIEAAYETVYDCLWVILAQKEVRILRLQESRGYSREKSLEIMANQLSDEAFKAHADVVIDNTGSVEETRRQIQKAMQAYL